MIKVRILTIAAEFDAHVLRSEFKELSEVRQRFQSTVVLVRDAFYACGGAKGRNTHHKVRAIDSFREQDQGQETGPTPSSFFLRLIALCT